MSASDIATLQARLTDLEQENKRLRSRLQSCEQSHGVIQAEVVAWQQQEQNWQEQRAIAREQEKAAQERAVELAKANDALKHSLSRLAEEPELNSFLGHILLEIVQQVGAASGYIFLYDSSTNTLELRRSVVNGHVHSQALPDEPELFQSPFSADISPAFEYLCKARTVLLLNERTHLENLAWSETLEWHRLQGHTEAAALALMAGDQPLGMLGLAFRDKLTLKPEDLELIQALTHQAALAIQLTRLAEEAKQAEVAEAIAREQEQAAQEQAVELAKANTALQQVIDALTAIDDLDEFVPATLRIVAQTFETENCAFYEHGDKALIYLRYWLMGDRVLRPDDLITLDGARFAAVRRTAGGFTVPDSYLGTPVRDRTRAVILDHTSGTSDPEFDQFTRENNWVMELNVPLVVDGYAEGSLVIYRPPGTTYTPAEIGLAEALGKQLALAMQASRLATEKRAQAVETAIAREQEKAAQERAAELVKANEALKRSVDVLATETDLNQFIGHVLQVTAEQFDAPLAEYWQVTNPNIGNIVGWWGRNQIHGFGQPHDHPAQESGVQVPRYMLEDGQFSDRRNHFVSPFDHAVKSDNGEFFSDPVTWYASFNVSWQLNLPLVVGETCFGVLNFWQLRDHPFTEQQIELGYALAQQVTLAIRLNQLAEEAQQAAIAREQEQAAQERAAELAKANEALKRSLNSLATEQSLDRFLENVLVSLAEQFNSTTAEYWSHPDGETAYIEMLIWEGKLYTRDAFAKIHPDHPGLAGYKVPPEMILTEPLDRRTQHFIIEDSSIHPDLFKPDRQWMYEHGIPKEINVPLNVGDHTIGAFVVRMPQNVEITTEKIELAWALANQVALALELTRLAEEAKQAAIAREQEKAALEQAAELAKANESLRRSLNQLANDRSLSSFLSHILREAIQMLDGAVAQIFLYNSVAETLQASVGVDLQGDVLPEPGLMYGLPASEPFLANITPAWQRLITQRRALAWDIDRDAAEYWPGTLEWHRSRGNQGVICVAMMIGEQPLGVLGVAYRDRPTEFTSGEFEFVQALGQQAALAIQLTQLAEEARQAEVAEAIAREQEKAAQQRAAELARANDALRRGVERLVASGTLDAALDAFLLEAIAVTEAASGAVMERGSGHEFIMRALAQDGALVKPFDPHSAEDLYRERTARDSTGVMRRTAAGEIVVFPVDDNLEAWFPEAAAYHRSQGHQMIWHFPFQVGGDVVGYLGLAFRESRSPSEVLRETVQALAHQASLALETQRLAEEAKQAAIAREQEKAAQARVAELTKANEALKQTVDVLATATDLDRYLGQVLRVIAEQFEAPLTEYWYHPEPDNLAYVGLTYWQGQILKPEAQPGHVGSFGYPVPPEMIGQESLHHRRSHIVIEDMATSPLHLQIAKDYGLDAAAWYASRGVSSLLNVPLLLADRTIGALIVFFPKSRPFTEQQIELAYALAQQVTLAIQLTRLAEETKQAEVAEAIAREQEQAAQQQAAELSKANVLLRNSLRRSSTTPNLQEVLGHLLIELVQYAGAAVGHLFSYDPTQATLNLNVRCQGDHAFWTPADDEPALFGSPIPLAQAPTFTQLCLQPQLAILNQDQFEGRLWQGGSQWVQAKGYQGICGCVLMVGDRPLGMLAMAFPQPLTFHPVEEELILALAQQIALVLQLTALAEETKQAEVAEAIAREQEQAAQVQAAELSRANSLLRNSLSHLSINPNLDDILGYLLVELVNYADASAGHLFVYDAGQEMLHLKVRCRDGQVSFTPAADEPVLFQAPISIENTQIFTQLRAQPRLAVMNQHEFEGRMWQGVPEWFQAKGYQGTSSCILMVGDRPFGLLAMAFAQPIAFHSVEEELILALAQQIALVIQLTLLSEADKQSAVAREQEKAAQERAAELAKANEVLRRSLDTLVAEQTLPGFLGHVLTSITHQLASPSSVLWLYDHERRTANLSLVFNGQTVKSASQTHHPNAKLPRDYSSPERAHAWETMIHQRQSELLVIATETRMTPLQRDYLLGQSIWGILSIPLVLGDRTEGTLAIHFHAPRQFREEELELVQTLANQAALAIQMAQLAEQAKEAALLEERNRLAGEIHDTLAQAFTGISMQLSVAKWLLQQDPNAVDQILDRINDIAQGGLAEARRSVWTLYPVEPAYADLAQQLSRCVKQMTSGTAMQVEVQISGSPCPLSPLVGKNLLRIGQEAITNTLKHAQATVLKIHLTYTEATLCLCLQDNGRGFLTNSDHTGFGLISMSDRADRIGGQLTIHSQPGQGTETTIQVPLP